MSCLSGTIGRGAQAAEWSAEPSLSMKGEYNSNLTLSSVPGEVWGYWVSPGVIFSGSTENLEVSGKVAADFVTYRGDQDRFLTYLNFPLDVRYSSEKDVYGFSGSFIRDNTLMTELLQTGLAITFTQRNAWSASPYWTRALTDRTSLQIGYQYTNVSYENGIPLGLIDYYANGANAGLTYKLTERDDLQVSGLFSRTNLPDGGLEIGIAGATLALSHQFTEATSLSLSAGGKYLDQKITTGGSSITENQVVGVYSAVLRTKWPDGQASLEASQDVNVSGLGILLRTDRLGASISKELTETVILSLAGQVFLVEGLPVQGTGVQVSQTRVITANSSLAWRLSDWWALEASYTYAERRLDVPTEVDNGHSVFLKLTYNMPKLSMSR
jgi:hypothetical protein